MLLLYLMVMVVGNVSLIVCDCHLHYSRHSDNISQHECCCGHCHASDFQDRFNSAVDSKCGCMHDHSTEVKLYTVARSSADDLSVRSVILAALLSMPVCGDDPIIDSCEKQDYSLYILPPPSSEKERCCPLRAPPAMV